MDPTMKKSRCKLQIQLSFRFTNLTWPCFWWSLFLWLMKWNLCQLAAVNKVYNTSFFGSTEPGDEKIMAEGIGRFCDDLNLDPASFKVLIIAWKFKAATQCEFTKKEFSEGMTELGYVQCIYEFLYCCTYWDIITNSQLPLTSTGWIPSWLLLIFYKLAAHVVWDLWKGPSHP